MLIIAYIWCLWGLYFHAPIALKSDMNEEVPFVLPVARCFALLNMTLPCCQVSKLLSSLSVSEGTGIFYTSWLFTNLKKRK
jgi:hypothetical protein